MLLALGEEYPIRRNGRGGLPVSFVKGDVTGACRLKMTPTGAEITYGSIPLALRAMAALMAGMAPDGGELCEQTTFTTFGIMLDCSRNAVMTVAHFKRWLRRLALMGYNMAMLYTEETYTLPDEPHFGRLRGRYSEAELREIDAYAAALGIEMIPCFQTLGHLEHLLKWPAYGAVKDTGTVMLVGEPQTYRLIEKMIRHWKRVFRSRRLHIGMDEAWDLGRGQYLNRNGHRDGFSIFNEHLERVVERCRKHDCTPMIWSDMYFRLGSTIGDYHDRNCKIPQAVTAKIPKSVHLVYWDYYHRDVSFYIDFIQRHRAMGFEPLMASGVWTWGKLWHDANRTRETAGPCIAACRETGLKEIFFTLWGDNGAYCDFDSALAGLAWCAETAFAPSVDDRMLAARFAAVCNADYPAHNLASGLESMDAGTYFGKAGRPVDTSDDPNVSDFVFLDSGSMLWEDPLMPVKFMDREGAVADAVRQARWERLETHYASLAEGLRPHAGASGAGQLAHAHLLARTLAAKVGMQRRLIRACARRNRREWTALRGEVQPLIGLLRKTAASLRSNWMARNKPFGFETLQLRMAGVIERCHELDRRLDAVISGRKDAFPELEELLKPLQHE